MGLSPPGNPESRNGSTQGVIRPKAGHRPNWAESGDVGSGAEHRCECRIERVDSRRRSIRPTARDMWHPCWCRGWVKDVQGLWIDLSRSAKLQRTPIAKVETPRQEVVQLTDSSYLPRLAWFNEESDLVRVDHLQLRLYPRAGHGIFQSG